MTGIKAKQIIGNLALKVENNSSKRVAPLIIPAGKIRDGAAIFQRMSVRIDKAVKAGNKIEGVNCNLKCGFCHGDSFIARKNEIAVSNDFFIASVSRLHLISGLPIDVHISGRGEPTLCGKELVDLVAGLKDLDFVETIKMTSNGLLLWRFAADLAQAGLDAINISLHSMQRERYADITGVDALAEVRQSIDRCVANGIKTKINCTAGPGLLEEMGMYLAFSREKKVPIKIFQILEGKESQTGSVFSAILAEFERIADSMQEYTSPYSGKILHVKGAVIDMKDSVINVCPKTVCAKRSACQEGCRYSIRINSDGYMQPCPVRSDNMVNLTDPGLNDQQIISALKRGGKYELCVKAQEAK